jgi:ParB family chromosome partitioning protein
MDKTEAREKTERIKNNLTEARQLLLEMYERNGWGALGYASWREYGQAEFGYSESRIYQLMDAAKTERNISTIVEINKPLPEGHLRPLSRLEPEQQVEVYQTAVNTAPNGKLTAAHVENVVMELTTPQEPIKPHVSNNSGNNEWYTPPEFIEAARVLMGDIDIDPASSDIANETIKANTYYTEETDGLAWDWHGRVWMNPPYAQPLIAAFCEKLVIDYQQGFVTEACVLVNNATETRWFNVLLDESAAVCFVKGRVKFLDMQGNPSGAPLQGQAVLYFGENTVGFNNCFSQFGKVLYAR